MSKRISFEIKERIVKLAGACFWYWNSFHSFLDSCGVPKEMKRKYPQEAFNKYHAMRNILNDLEDQGHTETINSMISNFYRMKNAVDRDKLDEKNAKQLLQEFRDAVGNDPIELAIQERDQKAAKAKHQRAVDESKSQHLRIEELNARFVNLVTAADFTPQQRGFRLEELFFDLLQLSEFEYSSPYRTPDREQIDGHFKYEKFDYLVEAKWTDGLTKQPDLSVFDGKIRGKAQSTRGFFISANGFDDTAVAKFSGDAPRIVLMTGEDLALVLSGHIPFFDLMKAKIDAIVRYGNINFPARSIPKPR